MGMSHRQRLCTWRAPRSAIYPRISRTCYIILRKTLSALIATEERDCRRGDPMTSHSYRTASWSHLSPYLRRSTLPYWAIICPLPRLQRENVEVITSHSTGTQCSEAVDSLLTRAEPRPARSYLPRQTLTWLSPSTMVSRFTI